MGLMRRLNLDTPHDAYLFFYRLRIAASTEERFTVFTSHGGDVLR